MNAATDTRPDWMIALFGDVVQSPEETAAELAAMRAEEDARKAAMRAAESAREAERLANRCPKCMGEGRIAQFSHRKGGECFACGGSGVFSRYKG